MRARRSVRDAAWDAVPDPKLTFSVVPRARRSVRSVRFENGVPVEKLRLIPGHASIVTTMRYAHLRPDHLDDTVAAIDAVLSGPNSAPGRGCESARGKVDVIKFSPTRKITSVGR